MSGFGFFCSSSTVFSTHQKTPHKGRRARADYSSATGGSNGFKAEQKDVKGGEALFPDNPARRVNTNKKSDSKGVKKANESDVSGGLAHHPSALTHRSRRATPRPRKLGSGCLSEWQRAYKTVSMHVEVNHQDHPPTFFSIPRT